MTAPDPAFFNGLPTSTQWVINAAIFIGGVFMMLWKYAHGKKLGPAEEAKDLAILTAGTIADMKPVREAVPELKRIADALEAIHAIMDARLKADKEAEDDQLRDRIRDLERALEDAGPARPRRR